MVRGTLDFFTCVKLFPRQVMSSCVAEVRNVDSLFSLFEINHEK